MSEHDPYAPKSAASAVEPVEDALEAPETPADGETGVDTDGTADAALEGDETPYADVPAGTTQEVLDWVGDDEAKAEAALEAEYASEEPRENLVEALEELLG